MESHECNIGGDLLLIFKSSSASGVLMKHATWTLSNLYRRKNPPLKSEYAARCLPILSQLLYHDNLNVISDTCWSLSFLADGSNKRIQQVIDAGVVMRLVELLIVKLFSVVIVGVLV
ncbi:importin subunit alpha-7-like isoform X1 [Dysidea avara]|uniref:importin subunit alpha-7-like isoform X1 n=1 Tax=Dysidea avara TaxID=196820 RepID=UPI00331DCD72